MQYKIPLDYYGFFQRLEMSHNKKQTHFAPVLEKQNKIKDSINQMVELVVFSHPGECKFLHDFGFNFWDLSHDNISIDYFNNTEQPRRTVEENLRDSIETYETRLDKVNVEVLMARNPSPREGVKHDYSVVVNVTGKIIPLKDESYSKTIVFNAGTMKKA